MIECDPLTNSQGVVKYVTDVNPLITCFDGNHWIYFAFCIVVMLLFIIVCFVVTFTYFEHKDKLNARADAFVMFSQICHVLIFALTRQESDNWILILFQFVFSFWMFANFIFFKPYNDKKNQKVREVIWGIYFWSCLLCLIAFVNNYLLNLKIINYFR